MTSEVYCYFKKEKAMEKNKKNTEKENDNLNKSPEQKDIDNTDKYLAMEQPGVKYTGETDSSNLSDELGSQNSENKWNAEGGNSKYSEAFNQDDYILNDNIDLDEDQNQSISSNDDDFEETNERY
ncbi:hypothetical protein GCM10007424_02930 [Flavobacterium suaedae]|uniref:Uncharacterized protein n=1 Tax=Flavobacterium suaedae TaxID=1767027 RepID=A0ABQ1JEB7_9FLAO|nr:hypothetical protein [Flavobacterium suaedae]GGB66374.1 hypothetical protein GCM10007424_02930 [Flavobacterium suaedae]